MRPADPPRGFLRALYLSGARPDAWDGARGLADAVIFDLEASVAEGDKAAARREVVERLASGPRTAARQGVRINAAGSPWHDDDLYAVAGLADFVLLPHAEAAAEVARLARRAPDAELWLMIESAAAVAGISGLALAAPSVSTLVLGYLDLTRDLGLPFDPLAPAVRSLAAQALESAQECDLRILDGVYPGDPAEVMPLIDEAQARGFDGATYISARLLGLHRLADTGAPLG